MVESVRRWMPSFRRAAALVAVGAALCVCFEPAAGRSDKKGDKKGDEEPLIYAKEYTKATGNFSGIFRNANTKADLSKKKGMHKVDGKTLMDVLQRGAKVAGRSADCLGRIAEGGVQYEDYDTVMNSVEQLGYALHTKVAGGGIPKMHFDDEEAQGGDFRMLGLFAQSSVEWLKTFYAASHFGITSVMIHSTMSQDGIEKIIRQTRLSVLVTDAKYLERLAKSIERIPTLTTIIAIGNVTEAMRAPFAAKGITVGTWVSVYVQGAKWKDVDYTFKSKPSDVLVLSYTSGSTGTPKGAMLTYENVLSTITSLAQTNATTWRVKHGDTQVVYLPLSHVYSMTAALYLHRSGARLAMWRGEMKLLSDDWRIAKPDTLCVVPAVAKHILSKVEMGIGEKGGISKYIAGKALKSAGKDKDKKSIWNKVFRVSDKVNNQFGGKLKMILNAGRRLDPHSQQALRTHLGVKVLNAYGLTETCGPAVVQPAADFKSDDVMGGPIPIVEYRIKMLPEFGGIEKTEKKSKYVGELMIRGQNVMAGYFRNPDATSQVLTKKGWLATGDIVEVLANGGLRMRDRAKSLIKLSQGEYVATEYIEGIYGRSPFVDRIWVFATDSNRMLKAIVCPHEANVRAAMKTKGVKGSYGAAIKSGAVEKIVKEDLARIATDANLNKYENINAVHIEKKAWEPDSQLVTPTMKLKRAKLKAKYSSVVDKLCTENV